MNASQREALLREYNTMMVTTEKAVVKAVSVIAVAGAGLLLHAPEVALGAGTVVLVQTLLNKTRRDAVQRKLMSK